MNGYDKVNNAVKMAASSYNKGKATTKSWLFYLYTVKDSIFVKRHSAN